jgi:hypothetical protein
MLKCVFNNIQIDLSNQTCIWWACYSIQASLQIYLTGLINVGILMELWSGWAYVNDMTDNGCQILCIGDGVLGFQASCTAGYATYGGTTNIQDASGGGAGGALTIISIEQPCPTTFTLVSGYPFTAFPFLMYDNSGNLVAGKTVAADVNINNGGWVAMINSPTSIGFGAYVIDLASADTLGNNSPQLPQGTVSCLFRFSAVGCKDTVLPIILQQPLVTIGLG